MSTLPENAALGGRSYTSRKPVWPVELAGEGHQLLLHGRNEAKLAQVAASIGGAETYLADFSDMAAVSTMAEAILSQHDHLDVLINNAGILKTATTQTKAGRDIRFDVNTIAPYLLATALLPIMGQDSRVVNLSSAAQDQVDVDAMMQFQPMEGMHPYAQSKLAITMWSAALAQSPPNGPMIVALNPGSLRATKMVKEGFGFDGHDLNIGADIVVRAVLSDDFAAASGLYFDNDSGQFASPHPAASNPDQIAAVMTALNSLK